MRRAARKDGLAELRALLGAKSMFKEGAGQLLY
jgi:hypothetical protein